MLRAWGTLCGEMSTHRQSIRAACSSMVPREEAINIVVDNITVQIIHLVLKWVDITPKTVWGSFEMRLFP
jgi:hypothetical protein